MKNIFIEAKSKVDIEPMLNNINIKGEIGLITTIQFLNQINKAKNKFKNAIIGGQILGCNINNALKIKDKVDSYLYIGSGEFHPLKVAIETKKPVYILNPNTGQFYKIPEKDIKEYQQKIKGKLAKFYNAKKIGIIVCTKPGQYNLKKAIELKKNLTKESFIFICNELKEGELENFKDIDFWVNTACPRINMKGVISYKDVVLNQ